MVERREVVWPKGRRKRSSTGNVEANSRGKQAPMHLGRLLLPARLRCDSDDLDDERDVWSISTNFSGQRRAAMVSEIAVLCLISDPLAGRRLGSFRKPVKRMHAHG